MLYLLVIALLVLLGLSLWKMYSETRDLPWVRRWARRLAQTVGRR